MFICIKMDLALNDLQSLIYYKTQTNNFPIRVFTSKVSYGLYRSSGDSKFPKFGKILLSILVD